MSLDYTYVSYTCIQIYIIMHYKLCSDVIFFGQNYHYNVTMHILTKQNQCLVLWDSYY